MVKGRPVITSSSKGMNSWRQRIATEAQRAMEDGGHAIYSGAIYIDAHFYMPRPKCIKNKAVPMDKRPDIDKLLRALNDALTGIAFVDDAQIVSVLVTKEYARPGDQPGVRVTLDTVEVSS